MKIFTGNSWLNSFFPNYRVPRPELKPQDFDKGNSRLYEYNETELEVNQLHKTLDENNEEFRHVRNQGRTRLQEPIYSKLNMNDLSDCVDVIVIYVMNKIVASLEDCELDDNNLSVECISEKNFRKFRNIHSSVADQVDN